MVVTSSVPSMSNVPSMSVPSMSFNVPSMSVPSMSLQCPDTSYFWGVLPSRPLISWLFYLVVCTWLFQPGLLAEGFRIGPGFKSSLSSTYWRSCSSYKLLYDGRQASRWPTAVTFRRRMVGSRAQHSRSVPREQRRSR
jgi:hypothetical protein